MNFLRRFTVGSALAAVLVVALLVPSPAQAWLPRPGWGGHGGRNGGWHGGWTGGWNGGWNGGWHPGWRGGVFIGGPSVVVGPPLAYAPAPYSWIPGRYTPYGWVPPHWGYY